MRNKTFVYRNNRPTLTVEHTGNSSLGRCYSESRYKVTSRRRLSRASLNALFSAGFLGVGQEFGVRSPCDGSEVAAGHDFVPCVIVDSDGIPTDESPINPYSGEPYAPVSDPYYVYECYSRCDSGD